MDCEYKFEEKEKQDYKQLLNLLEYNNIPVQDIYRTTETYCPIDVIYTYSDTVKYGIELKGRTNTKFDTLYFEKEKYDKMLKYAKENNLQEMIYVCFDMSGDDAYIINLKNIDDTIPLVNKVMNKKTLKLYMGKVEKEVFDIKKEKYKKFKCGKKYGSY